MILTVSAFTVYGEAETIDCAHVSSKVRFGLSAEWLRACMYAENVFLVKLDKT